MSLRIVPVSWRDAQAFTGMHHRTHAKPPPGLKFCQGVADEDMLVAVSITGRPVAAPMDDGLTLEVSRATTDGTGHANSMLYGAAARAAKALGYRRVITYTQDGESGASLRAAGYVFVAVLRPRTGWDCNARSRQGHGNDGIGRARWERICNEGARPWVVPSRPADPDRSSVMAAMFSEVI